MRITNQLDLMKETANHYVYIPLLKNNPDAPLVGTRYYFLRSVLGDTPPPMIKMTMDTMEDSDSEGEGDNSEVS